MHRRHVSVSPLARICQVGVLVLMLFAALGLLAHSMVIEGAGRQVAGEAGHAGPHVR
jgi:hypothetical protein